MSANPSAKRPEVGDVYWTETMMFFDGDHAEERPVVVVRAPRHDLDYVTVIQRSTHRSDLPGLDHAADAALGLERDGRWIFRFQRALRCDQFVASVTQFCGTLSDEYLDQLLEGWQNQP